MLEINGDTPTGLVAGWRKLRCSGHFDGDRMHFLHDLGEEDSYDGGEMEMTFHYLMDAAVQAGWLALAHPMAEVGWNPDAREYRDVHDEPIRNAFKLYAWEQMLAEPFGRFVVDRIEPAWKALLSTKALLPVLWELFPRHRLMLPAYFDDPRDLERWVAKPLHGREGDNIRIHLDDMIEDVVMPGGYGDEGWGWGWGWGYSDLPSSRATASCSARGSSTTSRGWPRT